MSDHTVNKSFEKQYSSSQYLIVVNCTLCIGAASCAALAPETFKLDHEQKAQIIALEKNDDDLKLLAAQTCPVGAIKVIDKDSNTVIWPKSS